MNQEQKVYEQILDYCLEELHSNINLALYNKQTF